MAEKNSARIWRQGNYWITDDPNAISLNQVEAFLRDSYWAQERPVETIERSMKNSLCLGLFEGDSLDAGLLLGFARVVTDYATFAWLCDVYVQPALRNQGLGEFLVKTALEYPNLKDIRWALKTTYSQSLYSRLGFEEISPSGFMIKKAAT